MSYPQVINTAHTDRRSTDPPCIHITTGAGSTDRVWVDRVQADSLYVQQQDKLILATTGPVTCVCTRTAINRTQTAIRQDEGLESKQGASEKAKTPKGAAGASNIEC